MKILIYGTGGVGGYFGGRLALDTDNDVYFTARSNYDTLDKNGLIVKSVHGDFELKKINLVKEIDNAVKYDVIFIMVKSFDTQIAVNRIAGAVHSETLIISLQNGIDNYDKLVEAFGENRVIRAYCRIASEMIGNTVFHTALGEIIFGEETGKDSLRTGIISKLFDKAGIKYRISENILHDVWVKFAWNCVFNMFTASSLLTVDKIIANEETYGVCQMLFNEVNSAAQINGVILTDNDRETILSREKNKGIIKTSTLIDRFSGKRMEYETFGGEIIKICSSKGIHCPLFKLMHSVLKAL